MRSLTPLTICLALLCAPGPSAPRAAEAPQLETGAPPLATQRYQNGRRLYATGDLPGAAAEFRSALALFPTSPKLAFNLARTLERMGELAEAGTMYRRYLALAPDAEDRVTIEALCVSIEQRVEAERPRLVVSTLPSGATVYLDEVDVGRTPLTVWTTVGPHVLRVTAEGHKAALQTVQAERGKMLPVALELLRESASAPPGAAVAAAPASAAPEPAAPATWRAPVGYGALGLGALGLGLGAYFGSRAADTADEANGLGPGRQARYAELEDRLGSQQLGFGLGLGLGLVAAGAGAALLLWPSAGEAP